MAERPNPFQSRTDPPTDPRLSRGEPQRFVPSGVDAQTWLGFEQRIQQRRYHALIQQIKAAIARRDGIAARVALEEANELRPDSAELGELATQIAAIPIAAPRPVAAKYGWSRAINAVSMLAAGVCLLIGIEWVRPTPPLASRTSAPAIVAVPVAAPVAAPVVAAIVPAPVSLPIVAVKPRRAVPPATDPETPAPVATVGLRRAVQVAMPAPGGPAASTFRQASSLAPRVPPLDGEVPDDYVAPQPRRQPQALAAATRSTAVASAIVRTPPQQAVLTPPPASPVVAPPASPVVAPPAPSSPAAAATTVAAPLVARAGDETRVTQVLTQYARAYDRLDASAARKVWPTVDERALARAFASLESQAVSFDNCDVSVTGTKARASCRGRATYVGKIGSRDPRTEARHWTFELRRDSNDAWQIETALAQRMAYQNR